jgi:hypothetical protein
MKSLFIKLTDVDDGEFFVNIVYLQRIDPIKNKGSRIYIQDFDNSCEVEESPTRIMDLINKAERF